MADYVSQLPSQQNEVRVVVEVDEDRNRQVTIEGLPDTAYDFGACMRIALRDMSINEELFRNGVKELHQKREQASVASRSMVSNPLVIVVAGVTIVVSEVVLEAGLYTVMVGVTVKVVEKAAKDIEEEGWKAVCIAKYAACIAAVGTRKRGNHSGISRCGSCLETCKNDHEWPSDIGNGSCEFWKPNWK